MGISLTTAWTLESKASWNAKQPSTEHVRLDETHPFPSKIINFARTNPLFFSQVPSDKTYLQQDSMLLDEDFTSVDADLIFARVKGRPNHGFRKCEAIRLLLHQSGSLNMIEWQRVLYNR